ncbi:sensor histidine kinase [Phytomonospora endophytica]|uniref:histidine kinase n=1 Tax=Phytomonospora endophytica TaxID=714109 RepID=A0A841FLT6_9ACTN|nr:histidine kinase [Phytomonospora endophytica]MBB6035883.1 signal transduction histidine kinase [Phytomonospora endophytica]
MILRPLRSPTTYRAWAWLIVGGALLMPYMMAGQVLTVVWREGGPGLGLLSVDLWVYAAALPVVALTGLILPVRAMETTAARALLGIGGEVHTSARGRLALWFLLHLGVGGLASGATLALVPFAVMVTISPVLGDLGDLGLVTGMLTSVGWLAPLIGVALLAALVYTIATLGEILRRTGARVLAPTPAERLAQAEAAAHRLTEQNRLARELHDSIGHALSIVTVQASAAVRVVDSDPGFARKAMATVEQTARIALADLDHVLGVLRADGRDASSTAPRVGLADVPELIDGSGLDVEYTVDGDVATVPVVVSREAYRIAQEGLTNAARHGDGGPVGLDIRVTPAALELVVRNRSGERDARPGGGRGLTGIRERAETLGGSVEAGTVGEWWELAVRLPAR